MFAGLLLAKTSIGFLIAHNFFSISKLFFDFVHWTFTQRTVVIIGKSYLIFFAEFNKGENQIR